MLYYYIILKNNNNNNINNKSSTADLQARILSVPNLSVSTFKERHRLCGLVCHLGHLLLELWH